ncbi:unnamed protein product [Symbiodinium necroappetens]|uniref:PHD and RING finger domain-containing protein 1 n=1 Tax=Symbiodinium necroappetens TaxID=1628268 RepID=A0A813A9C9_9DINO|nr:unnamed protein product [Symbiodinium necroappetens]
MDTTPRRSTRLQAALQEGRSGFSPLLESASAAKSAPKQCGACLLDVDTASKEGEFVAVLDSCNPTHFFHVRCISTWAEQENTCPLCKNRFSRVGVYGINGDLRRIITAEEKDQNSEGEASAEFEDHVCSICKRPGGDDALLLCDGRNGRCRGAAHFYCVGLPGVPEGDWFCAECQEFPLSEFVQDAVEDKQEPLGANLKKEAGPERKSSAAKRSPSQSPANRKPTPTPKKSRPSTEQEAAGQDQSARSSSSKRPLPLDAKSTVGSSRSGRSSSTPDPAVPRWIYRRGACLFVDLGGRRIKDSAAATVAKFLQSVLEKVNAVSTGSTALDLCLLLAGNRLSRGGLEAFLNVAKETGHHVSCLDVERNRLDPEAMQWLAEWLTRQRRGPPQKILLSHNRGIGDEAAKDFLQLLGRSQSGREIPLWIEARFVGIKDIDALLDAVSVDINLCMALDSDACGPGCCASQSASEPGPHLHLPGILEQHSNSELIPIAQDNSTAETWKRSLSESRASEGDRARHSAKGSAREPEEPGDSQASQASQVEAELLESLEQERAQRKAWANSLGRSVVAELPTQDLPAPAPSYGLWDLVRAEQRKKRRSVGHVGS